MCAAGALGRFGVGCRTRGDAASVVDDLVDLVERAGAVERAALASRWKNREDLESMAQAVRQAIDRERDVERRSEPESGPAAWWARVRADLLDSETDPIRPGPATGASDPPFAPAEATQAEAHAQAAVTVAWLALQQAHLAVLKARLARIDAGESDLATVDGHAPLPGWQCREPARSRARERPARRDRVHPDPEATLGRHEPCPSVSPLAFCTWASSAPSSGTPSNGCCPTSASGWSRS
jgi:hypothetical protein